jgi:hypothetical protein
MKLMVENLIESGARVTGSYERYSLRKGYFGQRQIVRPAFCMRADEKPCVGWI